VLTINTNAETSLFNTVSLWNKLHRSLSSLFALRRASTHLLYLRSTRGHDHIRNLLATVNASVGVSAVAQQLNVVWRCDPVAAVILLRHTHTKVLSHSTEGSVLFPALQLFSWDLRVACGRQKVWTRDNKRAGRAAKSSGARGFDSTPCPVHHLCARGGQPLDTLSTVPLCTRLAQVGGHGASRRAHLSTDAASDGLLASNSKPCTLNPVPKP
jgi:hypothetical protein